ncbi:hypothetical protein HMPREF7215_1573 [Pyramidobacter piscolens W5455]|uniref:Uncharacterized protein n=1 Tax=Pyramidobacter piscolens W5455 TaxID=352165 RepID=A0ABM9ZWZ8_9BACT|nr:hypothetical protein HMPREF7215_1573 [Pyramidobacter piscolens W5455]
MGTDQGAACVTPCLSAGERRTTFIGDTGDLIRSLGGEGDNFCPLRGNMI